jgi:hypothetical protein
MPEPELNWQNKSKDVTSGLILANRRHKKTPFFIHNSSFIIHNFLQRACYRAGIALEDKQ